MKPGRIPARSALVLVLIGLAAAVILAGINQLTRERIEHEQHTRALAAIAEMLPEDRYNNELLDDAIEMRIANLPRPATVYRARLDGEPTAAVIDLTTPRGYSGDIRMLVAVDVDGTVIGVRVLEHRETPGLGDKIEVQRSDWIRQFAGRSLDDPEPDDWAPDRRGGEFDTMTSATITASAVIDAIAEALQVVTAQDTELFEGQRNREKADDTE